MSDLNSLSFLRVSSTEKASQITGKLILEKGEGRQGIYLLKGREGPSLLPFIWEHLQPYMGEGNGTPLQYFAWKIPWMEEPGRLQSMGSLRVGHD